MGPFAIGMLLVAIIVGPPAAAQMFLAPGSGASLTISVDGLRRPLSSKALRWLRIAQHYGLSGDHQRAIRLLQETLVKEPTAAPYVQSMLSIEYLRTGRLADALPELESAVRLLPHEAVNHSNYAYALYLTGDYARAKGELQRALELDPQTSTLRPLIQALLGNGSPAPLDTVR
jgi:tetratricopeptide (TPR) repeat protein